MENIRYGRLDARKRKGGEHMQVVVIRSPKALRGILRRLFGIQKQ